MICFVLLSASKISHEVFAEAENELLTDANTHYHTNIGKATGFEILATVLISLVTAITFLLASASRSDDV